MVNKNKNDTLSRFEKLASHVGLAVMIAATMFSMAEVTKSDSRRILATLQPSYAYVGQNPGDLLGGHDDEQLRRGSREESCHIAASYNTLKRSNAISGTV